MQLLEPEACRGEQSLLMTQRSLDNFEDCMVFCRSEVVMCLAGSLKHDSSMVLRGGV